MTHRDVRCGMLHCQHLSEKLMFWKEALAFTMPEAWVLVNNTRHDCKGAILDVGLYMPDPGMVPDGAKCAERHVSIEQSTSFLTIIITRSADHRCGLHILDVK